MNNPSLYPMAYQSSDQKVRVILAEHRGRILHCYLPSLGLLTYFFSMEIPFWSLSNWYDFINQIESSTGQGYQIAGFIAFFISTLPTIARTINHNEVIGLSSIRGLFTTIFF